MLGEGCPGLKGSESQIHMPVRVWERWKRRGRLEPDQEDFVLTSFCFIQMVEQSHEKVFGMRAVRLVWCFQKISQLARWKMGLRVK